MPKKYDNPISSATDWGGDASTGYRPVTGRRVQEHIKSRFADAEGDIADIRGDIAGIRNDIDSTNRSVGTLRNDLSAVQRVAEANVESIGTLRRSLTSVSSGIEANNDDISWLREDIETIDGKVSANTASISEETAARVSAVNDEASARADADTALGAKIDAANASSTTAFNTLGSQLAALGVGKLDKSAIVTLTEDEYEGLTDKDPDKYYYTYED